MVGEVREADFGSGGVTPCHEFEEADWQPRSVRCNKCKRIFINKSKGDAFA